MSEMPESGSGSPSHRSVCRWAGDPERIDPDDYPAQQPFAKLMTWAPCSACQLQIHTPLTRYLLQGLVCPACGARLQEPPDDAGTALARALRQEDELSGRID